MYLVCWTIITANLVLVFADYERRPPGVPPKRHSPPAQEEEVTFHDPSEFIDESYQRDLKPEKLRQPHESHDSHGDHSHGFGESVDKEHMQEHHQEEHVDFSKMSEPEIVMYNFQQFDHGKDGMVDGLELFKHMKMQQEKHENAENNNRAVGNDTTSEQQMRDDTDQIISKAVDLSLNEYDANNDGYISFSEFYLTHMRLLEKEIEKKKSEKDSNMDD